MGTKPVPHHPHRRTAALLDRQVSERQFQRNITDAAEQFGWHWLHVRKSVGRRDGAAAWQTTTNISGWLDLLLWHERQHRVAAAEVKSETGRVTPEQETVIASLAAAGLETYVWYPHDWDDVIKILQGKP
jgi:hypothetical protein